MFRSILKRILIAVPLLLAMSLVTFLLIQMTPGNYFETLKLNPQISPETIARYERLYRLDQPVFLQYIQWLRNLLHFELGYSFFYNVPVAKILPVRMLNTFVLSFAGMLLTWLVAIPLGIWAAVRHGRRSDRIVSLFSFLFLSTPSFFLAILILFAASRLGGIPLGGMHSADVDTLPSVGRFIDLLRHLAIPVLVISLGAMASLQRIMRGNMLEVLGQQYILACRGRGLPENAVVYRHALRNAINPLITLFGYELSGLLSGAALTEIICNWPGLGSLMLTAVQSKDVYLVMASMMMGGVMLFLGNIVADVLLALADPRIRLDKGR